jgi:hypothetical protein
MESIRNRVVVGVLLVALAAFNKVYAQHATAQTAAAGSAPVTIVSPLPLPVTGSVRDAGRGTPFTVTSPKTSPLGEPPEVAFSLQVAFGQVAIVEHVSVRLASCPSGTLTLEDFRLHAGTKAVFLAPVHILSTFANAYIANESTKFVVEPGETISVETENFGTSGCGPADLVATISGSLVPLP